MTTSSNTTLKPRALSSSSIVGTNVVNRQNENMGEIKDLMIDLRTGEIQYCVLSFGTYGRLRRRHARRTIRTRRQ